MLLVVLGIHAAVAPSEPNEPRVAIRSPSRRESAARATAALARRAADPCASAPAAGGCLGCLANQKGDSRRQCRWCPATSSCYDHYAASKVRAMLPCAALVCCLPCGVCWLRRYPLRRLP